MGHPHWSGEENLQRGGPTCGSKKACGRLRAEGRPLSLAAAAISLGRAEAGRFTRGGVRGGHLRFKALRQGWFSKPSHGSSATRDVFGGLPMARRIGGRSSELLVRVLQAGTGAVKLRGGPSKRRSRQKSLPLSFHGSSGKTARPVEAVPAARSCSAISLRVRLWRKAAAAVQRRCREGRANKAQRPALHVQIARQAKKSERF